MACFDAAAQAFDWAKRDPRPGSMREGDWLIGLGCASACHPAFMAPATARVHLTRDGEARVETAAHDVGTGAYTVIAQIAAQRLGLDVSQVRVLLGDSTLPPSPVAGGSITTASVCNAVAMACGKIRFRLAAMAPDNAGNGAFVLPEGGRLLTSGQSERRREAFARLDVHGIEEYAEFVPRGSVPEAVRDLYAGRSALAGGTIDSENIIINQFISRSTFC